MQINAAAVEMRGCQNHFIFVVKIACKVMIGIADEMRRAFQHGVQAFILAVEDDQIGAYVCRIREMDTELPVRIP